MLVVERARPLQRVGWWLRARFCWATKTALKRCFKGASPPQSPCLGSHSQVLQHTVPPAAAEPAASLAPLAASAVLLCRLCRGRCRAKGLGQRPGSARLFESQGSSMYQHTTTAPGFKQPEGHHRLENVVSAINIENDSSNTAFEIIQPHSATVGCDFSVKVMTVAKSF